jgi:hypothetical protein
MELVQPFAEHSRNSLEVALIKLTIVQQVALAVRVFLAHQVVQARFAAHKFAGCRFSKPLHYGFAGLNFRFHRLVYASLSG